jgi:hypothetical protein
LYNIAINQVDTIIAIYLKQVCFWWRSGVIVPTTNHGWLFTT